MNTPNPLQPFGSQLDSKSKARSQVRLAVFFVITIHVVGLMAFLIVGCKREEASDLTQPQPPPDLSDFQLPPPPVVETNTNEVLLPPVQPVTPAVADSNYYATPPDTTMPAANLPPTNPVTAPPPGTGQEYAIQAGDTFYSIGKKFGVSMQAIAEANPTVDPKRLQIGKTIMIPPPKPKAAATPAVTTPGVTTYKVKSGDTLSRIARDYHTTVKAIREANNLQTTVIRVGQELKIPTSATNGSSNGGM